MNLRILGFLDVSRMAAFYVTTYRGKGGPQAEAGVLVLREKGKDTALLKKWKSAAALLRRIENEGSVLTGGRPVKVVRATVFEIAPGRSEPWAVREDEEALEHWRLRICLVPSPGHVIYSGGESAVLSTGQIAYVNLNVLHSEINVGSCSAAHLICDIRRPVEALAGSDSNGS